MIVDSPSVRNRVRCPARAGRPTWGELPSLQEYVLISQEQPLVEHFIRQPDDTWILERIKNLDASLNLTSASISLMLSEIYPGR